MTQPNANQPNQPNQSNQQHANRDAFGTGEPGEDAFPPVDQLNYETARDQLVEIVKILELGQMSLDESLRYWERAEELAGHCERQLARASKKVEDALARRDGGQQGPGADTQNPGTGAQDAGANAQQ